MNNILVIITINLAMIVLPTVITVIVYALCDVIEVVKKKAL